jgi:serine/threonine protein kinase
VAAERPPDTLSTIAPTLNADRISRTSLTEIPPLVAPPSSGGERYQLGELLGQGGMGEVLLATDVQIGRDVAIKRMRFKPSSQGYARFLREARVQGRLDHPAIVPVHELSVDADGRPFFAMKRLTGTTLHDILELLREGDPFAEERFTRQRLLRAFTDVCLAVEFAHTRGVIHRDLKPANIVLGDFGEVYVLDWGVARVLSDGGDGTAGAAGDLDSLGADIVAIAAGTFDDASGPTPAATEAGTILGTPGYIPPEQIRGDPSLDHRADVYALGCILFEILSNEPLFPRGRPGLTAPFGEIDARPSQRPLGRDVPPELDALCVAATRAESSERPKSARFVGDQVQRYLDGDRDLAMRKQVAAEHIAAARAALSAGDGEAARRAAMREAGRALALDPTATAAADLASRLILEAPRETPAEVDAELRELDNKDVVTMTKVALVAFGIYLLFVPAIVLIGVRSVWDVVIVCTAVVANAAIAVAVTRRKGMVNHAWIYGAVVSNAVLIGVFSWLFNPFLVAPGLAAGTMMAFSLYPFVSSIALGVINVLAVLGPWLLEVAGALPQTLAVTGGDLQLHAPGLHFSSPATEISLAVYVVGLVGVSGAMARRLSGTQRVARRTLQIQAWHLKQLMPR